MSDVVTDVPVAPVDAPEAEQETAEVFDQDRALALTDHRGKERCHEKRKGIEPHEHLKASGGAIHQVWRKSGDRAIEDGGAGIFRNEERGLLRC